MRFSNLPIAALVVLLGCSRGLDQPPAAAPAPVPRSAPESSREAPANPERSSGASTQGKLDPSEEIAPEELASIPEPVPAGDDGSEPISGATGGSIWRVQIFASPDSDQASRIGKEAAARFGEPYVVEFEGTLYKVRLGAFPREQGALALRDRAVREGFPGAFRMRSSSHVNDNLR